MKSEKFQARVLKFIASIPKGKVVSYGQVAASCGKPNGAREVGWILRNLDASQPSLPWWRVINNRGLISIKGNWIASKELQAKFLRKEGVKVAEDYSLDMQKYRYKNLWKK